MQVFRHFKIVKNFMEIDRKFYSLCSKMEALPKTYLRLNFSNLSRHGGPILKLEPLEDIENISRFSDKQCLMK